MIVLGIDPGSHRTGWGLVETRGNALRYIDSGTIAAGGASLSKRLLSIADSLDEILRRHAPNRVCVEAVFHHKNSQSALRLGHARGVILLCAARAGREVHEYTPAEIKRAVTGSGRADKEQVQRMVRLLLGCEGELGFDASDALAAAICLLHASPADALVQAQLAAQQSRRSPSGDEQDKAQALLETAGDGVLR